MWGFPSKQGFGVHEIMILHTDCYGVVLVVTEASTLPGSCKGDLRLNSRDRAISKTHGLGFLLSSVLFWDILGPNIE